MRLTTSNKNKREDVLNRMREEGISSSGTTGGDTYHNNLNDLDAEHTNFHQQKIYINTNHVQLQLFHFSQYLASLEVDSYYYIYIYIHIRGGM